MASDVAVAEGGGSAAVAPEGSEPTLKMSMRGYGADAATTCFTSCIFVPMKRQVASGTHDGAVLLWPLDKENVRPTRLSAASPGVAGAPVTCVAASEDGQAVASSSTDGVARVWQNRAGPQTSLTLKVHFGPVRCCDFAPHGARLLLTCSDDKTVKLSSLPGRKFVASFVGHFNWVQSARFSPCGGFVASGGDDRTVRLWDAEKRTALRVWHDHGASVACVRFDSSGNAVAGCSWDSTVNIWDVRSHALRQHYGRAHGSSPISEIAFHPTEDLLLSASTDRTVRLWDLRAGRARYTVRGHGRPVRGCAWDEDGVTFASCDDEIVHLWNFPECGKAAPASARRPPPAAPLPRDRPASQAAVTPARPASRPAAWEAPAPQGGSTGSVVGAGVPTSVGGGGLGLPEVLLQAAWGGRCNGGVAAVLAPGGRHDLEEALARTLERMVSQMDLISRSLQAIEGRVVRNEQAIAEMAADALPRRS